MFSILLYVPLRTWATFSNKNRIMDLSCRAVHQGCDWIKAGGYLRTWLKYPTSSGRGSRKMENRAWVWPLLFCLCAIAGFSEGCPLNMHPLSLGKGMITLLPLGEDLQCAWTHRFDPGWRKLPGKEWQPSHTLKDVVHKLPFAIFHTLSFRSVSK